MPGPGPGPKKEVGGACLEYPKASTGGKGPTELSPPLRSHLPEILGHESRMVILSYKHLLSQKENSQNVRDERSFVGKNLGQIPKNFQVSLSQQGFLPKCRSLDATLRF